MNDRENNIIRILIQKGNELFKKPYEKIKFTKSSEANDLLNDLQDFPHAFVLACVMDRQMKAEKAWLIPYEISREIQGFRFSQLLELSPNFLRGIFKKKNLHRFNTVMADNFYSAVQKIHDGYQDNALNIWKGKPRSAAIVRKFLDFKGVGVKIATMATNILAREFKIPMEDYICVDISPDVHVKRVFKRLGLIPKNASNEELIYRAREMNPLYPGIFDYPCFQIGRNWCRPTKPHCGACYLDDYCPKN